MGGRRQQGIHVVFRVGPVAPVLTIALERDQLLRKLPGSEPNTSSVLMWWKVPFTRMRRAASGWMEARAWRSRRG